MTTARIHLGYDGFLGIELATGTTSPTVAGLISGTPAARAGVTTGSMITTLNDQKVSTAKQLHRLIAAHRPGDVVHLTWRDASGSHSASLRLMRGPAA